MTNNPSLNSVTAPGIPAARTGEPTFRYDVAVVGLGYVGLPTALALHKAGKSVLGLEISCRRLDDIRAGRADLLPSDNDRLAGALDDEHAFQMTTDTARLAEAATVLVCVPTPIDHHLLPDLKPLAAACVDVVAHTVSGQTLILTSTTYVGCTRDFLVEPLRRRGLEAGSDIFVVFAPERIDPGVADHAQADCPRVVGGVTEQCVAHATELLAACAGYVHPVSSVEAAEMTKLYENTFRAVNISLANEFADISRGLGVDIVEVIAAAATKPYGFMPFHPGPGVGGHCIPCDPHYLLWQLRADRVHAPLIETAMERVASRPGNVVRRCGEVLSTTGTMLAGAKVLVLGVAYKPDVADVRESPALEIIDRLRAAGATVSYADPHIDLIDTADGELTADPAPEATEWDLVLVHTLHRGADIAWLERAPVVLDATFRLHDLKHRHVL
ncbi:nucleotide sugar dehydrogenase [Mangrovihabitans endophyticus]|uniref:Nucleotide sugar dehydrogenase n=1 Tax=Mangrovihabitans endophyticus TaxID=1751298 RepID=A0A8J3C6V9_9ACTN|nr:nucleotide sugar dehydrogenase [Mangrovihabitans endophyticus]GGL17153.1 nucleotide sugar dehydrogenase [Mangrovihabitans endophyticus]